MSEKSRAHDLICGLTGETGFRAQMAATAAVVTRIRTELAREQQALTRKYGVAAASGAQLDLLDGETGELPMVKLGDASIAAPFTSKLPSIRSCVDIIRQERCEYEPRVPEHTLVNPPRLFSLRVTVH